MATDANTVAATTAATPAAKKPETVIDNMDSRRMFDTVDEASAYLNSVMERFSDFDSHELVLVGVDADGNFDPEIYTADMRVMVAVLANRGEMDAVKKVRSPSTVKAIIVTPAPKLESILNDDAGKLWAAKILDKELNHVAVRPLRTADDVQTVADQMPRTLADYISSSRESTGGIMETFNALFKGIIASVGQKSSAWAKRRLVKSDLKRAFESKAFALEYFPELEDRGDKPSLFVMAMQLGQREASKQGLDPAIFNRWIETRDAKPLATKAQQDESDDFDLDDLAFETGDDATPAPAPAAE